MVYKEIYSKDEARDLLLSGVNKLADTVLLTMGPNGKTVIISNENREPYASKDGVSVAKEILFNHPVENYAATLIKQAAKKTVEEAGDGTTTATCLAQSFINTGYKLMSEGIPYNKIKSELEELEKEVLKELKKVSKKLTKKDIINVATIAANNDTQIGSIIKKAYDHSNIIRVEESDNSEDTLETVNGMELDGCYFSQAFVNNAKKQSIEYDKCNFIIIDGKLENLDPIAKLLKGVQLYPTIILADHFHDEVVSILKRNYNSGALAIGLIKSPSFAQHRKDLISDIISYTDAVQQTNPNVYVSEIDGVFADKYKFVLTKKNPNKSKISDLKESIKTETNSHFKKLIQDRIDNLEGSLSIIKVGGGSEVEMKERKDRIDDAVLAVKSAIEEGIVEGGGVALCKIFNKLLYTKTPILELSLCLGQPYGVIFNRIEDNKVFFQEDLNMFDINIVDPHKVTRCAFQNAISVAKTFLSIEAIVLTPELW